MLEMIKYEEKNTRQGDEIWSAGCIEIFVPEPNEGLIEKVTSEWKPTGSEGVIHVDSCGRKRMISRGRASARSQSRSDQSGQSNWNSLNKRGVVKARWEKEYESAHGEDSSPPEDIGFYLE